MPSCEVFERRQTKMADPDVKQLDDCDRSREHPAQAHAGEGARQTLRHALKAAVQIGLTALVTPMIHAWTGRDHQ